MVVMVLLLYEFNQRYSVGILCGITLSGDFLDDKRASHHQCRNPYLLFTAGQDC